jgi:hypothetical protein
MVSRFKRRLKDLGEAAAETSHPDYPKYQSYQKDLARWENTKANLELAKGGVVRRK